MHKSNPYGLTPALVELLAATIEIGTAKTEALAKRLCRSEGTIRKQWGDIFACLQVSSRFEAVLFALENRIVLLNRERLGQALNGVHPIHT